MQRLRGQAAEHACRPSPTVGTLSDAGALNNSTSLEKARLEKISAAVFFQDASGRAFQISICLKNIFFLFEGVLYRLLVLELL